jgi:hypothetical protein
METLGPVKPLTPIRAVFPAMGKTAIDTRVSMKIFFANRIVGGYFIIGWH